MIPFPNVTDRVLPVSIKSSLRLGSDRGMENLIGSSPPELSYLKYQSKYTIQTFSADISAPKTNEGYTPFRPGQNLGTVSVVALLQG